MTFDIVQTNVENSREVPKRNEKHEQTPEAFPNNFQLLTQFKTNIYSKNVKDAALVAAR